MELQIDTITGASQIGDQRRPFSAILCCLAAIKLPTDFEIADVSSSRLDLQSVKLT